MDSFMLNRRIMRASSAAPEGNGRIHTLKACKRQRLAEQSCVGSSTVKRSSG